MSGPQPTHGLTAAVDSAARTALLPVPSARLDTVNSETRAESARL